MIYTIGEAALQQTVRADHNNSVNVRLFFDS